jgi:cell division protein FtsB
MKLRDLATIGEIILLLALFAAYMLGVDIQQGHNRNLDEKIAALKAEHAELLRVNLELKERVARMKADLCRAMITGSCPEEP